MTEAEEIAALRADISMLKASSLTVAQRDAVDRLADHVDALVRLVDEDQFKRTLWTTVRSWSVAIGAVVAAVWVVKDGLARALRALVER